MIAAFMLGVVTKCYRDTHPSPAPVQTDLRRTGAAAPARAKPDQARALNRGKETREMRRSPEELNLSAVRAEQEHRQK
jgi:hypothetical protein